MKRHATRNTVSPKKQPVIKQSLRKPALASASFLVAATSFFLISAFIAPKDQVDFNDTPAKSGGSLVKHPLSSNQALTHQLAAVQPLEQTTSMGEPAATQPPQAIQQETSLTPHPAVSDDLAPKQILSSLHTNKTSRQGITDGEAHLPAASEPAIAPNKSKWAERINTTPNRVVEHTIKSGDNLAKVFHKHQLDPVTLHHIMNTSKESKQLSRLRPGQTIELAVNAENQLLGLSVQLDALTSLWVTATDSDQAKPFQITTEKRVFDKKVSSAHGVIKNSLFLAGQEVGLSEKLIMELANIFGWDIDFALDIRSNDSFSVLYEENLLEGKKHSDGNILAAEFTNAGKTYTAVRFESPDGHAEYYTADGYSVRKAFLRSPVDFARISSHFNLRRKHPILHTIRAHKGVDYAAGRGTPIKAVGDGKVILAGRKGGYGKTVILQHGQKYTTLYAHMHRYAKGIKNGKRVKQGQIIGYVGSSGLATGPHLHYEFRTNGRHVNPLTVKFPKSAPIKNSLMDQFNAHASSLLAKLPMSKSQARYASREGSNTNTH